MKTALGGEKEGAAASRAAPRRAGGTDEEDRVFLMTFFLSFVNETHLHLGMSSKDWKEIYFQLMFISDAMSCVSV